MLKVLSEHLLDQPARSSRLDQLRSEDIWNHMNRSNTSAWSHNLASCCGRDGNIILHPFRIQQLMLKDIVLSIESKVCHAQLHLGRQQQ